MTIAVAFTLEFLAISVVEAQTPSKWCEYLSRSPQDIMAHAHLGDSADITMSAGQFPSRVTLRYTGNIRAVPSDRRLFLRDYFKSLGQSGIDTLVRHEVEFAQAGDSTLWLPIQETMLHDLRSELRSGDTSTIFLLWAGSYRPFFYERTLIAAHASRDYLFLVNEFSSRESHDHWNAALATCNQ